jgi:serine phosphatase RsbU (regulator of sigma subunit)
MLKPPIPQDEEQRLQDLRRLDMLLTTPEEQFDAVTRRLARIFNASGVSISFFDRDTQYYKSAVGLPPPYSETRTEPRELSVCSHVVGNNEMLVVEDLQADDRFRDNPIVLETGVRFYAGAPLRAESGRPVGTICIVDTKPRTLSRREAELLQLLAGGVMAQVKLQVASRKLLDRTVQIDRDLQQAVRVQRFLLPPARIEGDGWRIEHLYRPADRLCGDFVDVHRRRDGRLAILVADVSGHGTSAALTAVMIKTAFLRAAPGVPSPADLLSAVQRELVGMAPPDRFLTAVAALFDPTESVIDLASAGHPPPLLITARGIDVIRQENGMVLLVTPETEYRDGRRLKLDPGNRLLIYTDGAIEASAAAGEMLDVDGLIRLAGETAKGPGDAFLQTLFGRIKEHAKNRLQDDVSLLSVAVS